MGNTFTATAVLVATIIGAGILALPYVIAKAGFLPGITLLILIGITMAISMLYLGEIILRTNERHQLVGYARKYLGKKGRKYMSLSLLIGIYAALIGYLIIQGNSWSVLLVGSEKNALLMGIAFWVIASAISYKGIKTLKESESLILVLLAIMLLSIAILYGKDIDVTNLLTVSFQNVLSPLGVIIFAFLGYTALPEIARILHKEKKSLKKSIIGAYTIAALVYIIFTALIIGIHGSAIAELATLSLGKPFLLLGIITVFGAYISVSTALMDTFQTDYKLNKREAAQYTLVIPLAAYCLLSLLNKASLVSIIGLGGALSGGIVMILIMLMAKKAKIHGDRYPEYTMPNSKIITRIIIVLAILGILAELYAWFSTT